MKRYNVEAGPESYAITHIESKSSPEISESTKIIALIVPFLYDKTEKQVEKTIDNLLKEHPHVQKVFVLNTFSNIHAMTALVKSNPKIYVTNIMCIVDMELLLKLFTTNCKVKEFDFVQNEELLELMLDYTKKELFRKEKN